MSGHQEEREEQGLKLKPQTIFLLILNIFPCQIAAQNCRKRKLEQICLLETDLTDARTRKEELVRVKNMNMNREKHTKS